MDLGEYFEQTKGRGILATADASGKVNVALYSRPHFMDDGTAAFIMAERLTYENLKTNPWAAYLFMESKEEYSGKRLYLRKIKEEQNEQLINEIRRKGYHLPSKSETKHIVYFEVEKVLPLIGSSE
ncbi:pyridoxamine 5'-phosphate oxidase family protein [Chloroflexota bacterium]